MTTYLITGGEGFIGYHISKRLLDFDHTVISYDANKHYLPLSDSYWPEYKRLREADLGDAITRERGDITDQGRLAEAIERHDPDVVIHLAGLSLADVSNQYPGEAYQNNLKGTVNVLESLKGRDFDRLVFFSSSMAYGNFEQDADGNPIPPKESDTTEPIEVYGATKLSGEVMMKAYGARYGLPWTIIRPSAVYGPTDANKRVTEIFVNRVVKGEPLELHGGGEARLDFTYVKDLAEGVRLASEAPEAEAEIFNMTRGEGRSIKELAEIVIDTVGNQVELKVRPRDGFRPKRGALDITKARKRLGYEPRFSLEEGIAEYVEFVQESGVVG